MMQECRTLYSTVDKLFHNVQHAAPTPKPRPQIEVCEAMDSILSADVVATVIGLTGAATPCDECWRQHSFGALESDH